LSARLAGRRAAAAAQRLDGAVADGARLYEAGAQLAAVRRRLRRPRTRCTGRRCGGRGRRHAGRQRTPGRTQCLPQRGPRRLAHDGAHAAHRSHAAGGAACLPPTRVTRSHRNMDHTHSTRLSHPPIHRASMVPAPWLGFVASLRAAWTRRLSGTPAARPVRQPWEQAAARRRNMLLWAIALSAGGAAMVLGHAQPLADHPALRVLQVGLYSLLFAWVTAGFVTAMMGFV